MRERVQSNSKDIMMHMALLDEVSNVGFQVPPIMHEMLLKRWFGAVAFFPFVSIGV